eukprot:GEMP01003321.1.p1 GENE.GEMP01003321.1~~GEMP01003321.1.p1  ORF type:complete len:1399 (+),score=339.07 GEMP01003321.1:334-4197(+)
MVIDRLWGVQLGEKKLVKSLSRTRPVYDRQNKQIFENRFRTTMENPNECRKAMIQKRFFDEKLLQEARKDELDKLDFECYLADRARNRNLLLEKMSRNRYFIDRWHEDGVAEWKKNMGVRMQAEEAEIKFEQQTMRHEADKTASIREAATNTVVDGIANFEKELEQKGEVPMSNDIESLLAHSMPAKTQKELLQGLEERLPSAEARWEEASTFLGKIKNVKIAGIQARKSREKRRRRVLVNLGQEQDRYEEDYFENLLGDVLQRRSNEEARMDYQVWKTAQYGEVVRANRTYRVEQYQTRRKDDMRVAISRDLDLKQQMLEQIDDEVGREGLRYRALERGRMARRKARTCLMMENLLDQIGIMAISSEQQQQICDVEEVDSRLWNDWLGKARREETLEFCATPNDISKPYVLPHDLSTATLESDYHEYITRTGQWALESPTLDMENEITEAGLGEETTLSFASKLHPDTATSDGANLRLGLIVESLILSCNMPPPPAMPEPMPAVPLRLIMAGKALSGKKSIAFRLADQYNLKMLVPDEVVREAMTLAGRPESSTFDEMRVSKDNVEIYVDEAMKKNNPHVRELQRLGKEIVEILQNGSEITSEFYVKLMVAKLRAVLADGPVLPYPDPPTKDEGELRPFGWVLVGFPRNVQEASSFEWELSGFVAEKQKIPTEDLIKLQHARWLAPRPETEPTVVEPTIGGVDAVFLLESTNDELTQRASGRRVNPNTGLVYHVQDNPPPQKMRTKEDLIYEHLIPIDDLSLAMGTFTDRAHQADVRRYDLDPFLEHFSDAYGPRLRRVPVDAMSENTFANVESQVKEIFERKQKEWAAKLDVIATAEAAQAAAAEEEAQRAAEKLRKLEEEQKDAAATKETEEGVEGEGTAPSVAAPSATAEEEKKEEEGEGEEEQGEKPIEPYDFSTLQQHIKELEEGHRKVLCAQWEVLQDTFTTGIQQVISWQRQHLDGVRHGIYLLRLRMCEFLQRPHDFESRINAFVRKYNAFLDEYPEMSSQKDTKDEMHKRISLLRDEIKLLCAQRRTECAEARTAVMESQFIEMNKEIVARQAARLFHLEGERYRATCRLLSDSYHSILGENLPDELEPPERPDFFANGVREFNEEENVYKYPFLEALNQFARSLLWPHEELANQDKEMKGLTEQQYVDFQKALLCERFLYLQCTARIETWTLKRFAELDVSANRLYESMERWIDLRENSERLAVGEVIIYLRSLVEQEKRIEHQIRITGCKVVHEHQVRLYERHIPPPPRVKEEPPTKEWCSDHHADKCADFYAQL